MTGMTMEREALLKTLKIAEPALATKDLVEELTHFWFDSEKLLAYNDVIGIELPFASNFKGGVRGNLLIGFLDKSNGKDVDLEVSEDGKELQIKCGAGRMKLAMLGIERRIFSMPKVASKAIKLEPVLLSGIAKVMVSVGQDTSIPDQLGITFIPDGKNFDLYTTDAKTICWLSMNPPEGWDRRAVVPSTFCDQLLRLAKNESMYLYLTQETIVSELGNGIWLFSRLIEPARPLDFDAVLNSLLSKGYSKKFVKVPERMKQAIERAGVITDNQPGTSIEFGFNDAKLYLHAKTIYGEINDSLLLDPPHDKIDGLLDADLVKRGLELCNQMQLNSQALIMAGDGGFVYVIAQDDPKK